MSNVTATKTKTKTNGMFRKAARIRKVGIKAYATKRLPQIEAALKNAMKSGSSERYIARLKSIRNSLQRVILGK